MLVATTIAVAFSGIAKAANDDSKAATPSRSASAAPSPHGEDVPPPAAVTVDPKTTAYLVLDDTTAVCAPNPACGATLSAAAGLLDRARAAGALVVYSITVNPGDAVLPEVSPQPGDPIVAARADKFFGTDLDQVLSTYGIKTVVIVGTKANGAILYTAYEASVRGYTVVVAEDGVSSDTAFIQLYSLFQLLNAPGAPNATNTPLAPNATTLSATPLITFGSGS
ncbi:MAG: cysteine hydrolase [Polyangiaceae bacterium]|nr:cysteine hydrolase [Polyangiaceae bacterium]